MFMAMPATPTGVNPARAGMIRKLPARRGLTASKPRASGDDPTAQLGDYALKT